MSAMSGAEKAIYLAERALRDAPTPRPMAAKLAPLVEQDKLSSVSSGAEASKDSFVDETQKGKKRKKKNKKKKKKKKSDNEVGLASLQAAVSIAESLDVSEASRQLQQTDTPANDDDDDDYENERKLEEQALPRDFLDDRGSGSENELL